MRPAGSLHERKSLLLEVGIERERLANVPLAHRDERYGIDEAQRPFTAVEQEIEPRLAKRFVDPHDVDKRSEVRPEASDCIETEASAQQSIRFNQHVRRGYQCRLTARSLANARSART